jgi:hypothetical protein
LVDVLLRLDVRYRVAGRTGLADLLHAGLETVRQCGGALLAS